MASILGDALRPELVKLRLEATDKPGIIRELLDILDDADLLSDRVAAEQVVFDREEQLSTGLHGGVAIPHGKTDTVDRLLVAIALQPDGVDFDSVDGQPSRIFIVTLSPASGTGPHIQFMAEISRLLQKPVVRQGVLAARTPAEVVRLLTQSPDPA